MAKISYPWENQSYSVEVKASQGHRGVCSLAHIDRMNVRLQVGGRRARDPRILAVCLPEL